MGRTGQRTGSAALLALLLAAAAPGGPQQVEPPAQSEAKPPAPSAPPAPSSEAGPGGFPLTNLRVPAEHVVSGGPPRDAIRSIDAPTFAPLAEARWVGPTNPVIGVFLGGEARAYPVHVIERHQIVNDVVGGVPVVVTYDPLAGSPLAFERRIAGSVREFGVAGLLYNSNFLLYDRGTESLWSPLRGEAISGPLAGTRPKRVAVRQETLALWVERHRETTVLVPPTREIDYRYSPYTTYWISEEIPSRVDAVDPSFHPKEVVLAVEVEGVERAYLGSRLTEAGGTVEDEVAGRRVRVEYFTEDAVFRYEVPDDVRVTEAYWFAWKAFHPDTGVWAPSP